MRYVEYEVVPVKVWRTDGPMDGQMDVQMDVRMDTPET